MCEILREAGYHPGLWFRPEFTKTSLPAALSERIPTAEMYYGYSHGSLPGGRRAARSPRHPAVPREPQVGAAAPRRLVPLRNELPVGAHEPDGRLVGPHHLADAEHDGHAWASTACWSTAGSAACRAWTTRPCTWARPTAPWPCSPIGGGSGERMEHLGIRMFGECTVGWKGGNVVAGGTADELYSWMFHMGWYIGSQGLAEPRADASPVPTLQRHARRRRQRRGAALRARVLRHAPRPGLDRVEGPTARRAGGDDGQRRRFAGSWQRHHAGEKDELTLRVRPWIWTDVVWHYADGATAVYPSFDNAAFPTQTSQ